MAGWMPRRSLSCFSRTPEIRGSPRARINAPRSPRFFLPSELKFGLIEPGCSAFLAGRDNRPREVHRFVRIPRLIPENVTDGRAAVVECLCSPREKGKGWKSNRRSGGIKNRWRKSAGIRMEGLEGGWRIIGRMVGARAGNSGQLRPGRLFANAEGARPRFQGHRHLSVRPHACWLATCPGTFSVSPADIMPARTGGNRACSPRYAFFNGASVRRQRAALDFLPRPNPLPLLSSPLLSARFLSTPAPR